MDFLYAISGWQWGLAGAVPVGILALYFLKLKRKPLEVPSTFLWKKSIEDLHVNSLWQRLRKSILLLLQLLIAAAIILALLRPTIDSKKLGKHIILVIDNSASMSATDVDPNRLEVAKKKALQVTDQMRSGDVAMVIACSDTARVVCTYTGNGQVVKRAISSIESSARRTNIYEAVVIASGLANPQRSGEDDAEAIPADLYLFSDGKFPEVTDLSLGNLALKYVRIGDSRRNVGLVALAVRRNDSRPDRLDVFGRVHNYDRQELNFTAKLLVDGRLMDIQQILVGAEEDQSMTFRLNWSESATISVQLEVEDDFSLDDQAWAVIDLPRRARVIVVGDDNPILKAVLETSQLRKICQVTYMDRSYVQRDLATDPQMENFDLILFDRCSPEKSMPDCNTFLIGALPTQLAELPKTKVEWPVLLNWDSSHPVLRFLRLDDVNVYEAFTVPSPPGANRLIESDQVVGDDQRALLFEVSRGVHTDLVQTFALLDENEVGDQYSKTDWLKKPSFPLFMMNVIRVLGGIEAEGQGTILAGDPVTLRSSEDTDTVRIALPSGRIEKIRLSPQGTFEFLNTEELGVYQVKFEKTSRQLAVNLFDEAESAIAPAESVQVGAVSETDVSSQILARQEFWKPLALLALLILLLEWYIYNRRVYV